MLNHITVMGRFTRPPELKKTQSGVSVCSFSIACDRDFTSGEEKKTDFFNCTAWRGTAEFISKYFDKGSMIIISGRLNINSYDDKDGNKRSSAEIVCDNVYFGESKKASSEVKEAAPVHFEEARPEDEEGLPF